MPETPLWFWVAFLVAVVLILAFDLGWTRRHREAALSLRSALARTGIFAALAVLFAAGVHIVLGAEAAVGFVTGYLIEWSLSVDNVFVFVLVFAHFSVPEPLQHRVLFWGIFGALIMRGVMIAAGAALLAAFHWVEYAFGAILIVSGIKMLMAAGREPDMGRNRLIAFLRRHLRVTEGFEGRHFLVRRTGLLYATPLLLALVVIEFSDLVFAIDSIPAIFAVTSDPFIVYTSNVFAILGLRSLYFALAGVVHRFHYLKYGLAIVLVTIGVKMIVNSAFGDVIPVWLALAATAALVAGSIVLSLFKTAPARAPAGWVPGSPPVEHKKA
jgi:tellurite resistance protein TerC